MVTKNKMWDEGSTTKIYLKKPINRACEIIHIIIMTLITDTQTDIPHW